MRRLVTWTLMTLDGRFEDGPQALDFSSAVWGDELEAFSIEQLGEVGTLLFGRRTYEGMASYWSGESGPIADRINAIDKIVVSRSLENANWQN